MTASDHQPALFCFNTFCFLNLAMKVFWRIHSVEYIRPQLQGSGIAIGDQ